MSIGDLELVAGYTPTGVVRPGGSSTVYQARVGASGELVAVKVALVGHDLRVERETSFADLADHPHLAVAIASGRLPSGRVWTASRWVDGVSLAEMLRRDGTVSLEGARSVLSDIGAGLSALHAVGVVHRDVTPSNVIVDGDRAVVIDLGLGRRDVAGSTVTATGELAGTPRYLAPEVIRGEPASNASDQYALAIVVFEMLTGRWPFPSNGSVAAALHHQLSTRPTPLDELRPDLPAAMSHAIERALTKSPEQRWPGVDAFIAALDGSDPWRPGSGRSRRVLIGAAVAGALAVSAAILVAVGGGDEPAAPADASTDVGAADTDGRSEPVVEVSTTETPATTPATTPVAVPSSAGAPSDGAIPAAIASPAPAGTAAALECNLVADAGFESGVISDNFFDNPDPDLDGSERILPSGGVDGSEVLVVGDPARYGRYGNEVAVLPGQRYEFSAAVLPVAPLAEASIAIVWLDAEYELLDEPGGEVSIVDVEPGRHTVVSDPAPAAARFAIPQITKDASSGLLLADELVFAEVDADCGVEPAG